MGEILTIEGFRSMSEPATIRPSVGRTPIYHVLPMARIGDIGPLEL
jgi:hypothetical protein